MSPVHIIVPAVVLAVTIVLAVAAWRAKGPRSWITFIALILVGFALVIGGLDVYLGGLHPELVAI